MLKVKLNIFENGKKINIPTIYQFLSKREIVDLSNDKERQLLTDILNEHDLSEVEAMALCEKIDLEDLQQVKFLSEVFEKQNIRKKPAPDTVFEALRQLGVGKDNAVYVGDSDVDIQTARNSGLPCISVLWGFRDRNFLQKNGAETFISAPSELLSL